MDIYKIHLKIPDFRFVIHCVDYPIRFKLCRGGLSSIDKVRAYLDELVIKYGLSHSVIQKDSHSCFEVTLSGYGLLPSHIYKFLYGKVHIIEFHAKGLEVKCYPTQSFLKSAGFHSLSHLPDVALPLNRCLNITTHANKLLPSGEHLSVYEVGMVNRRYISWGLNCEIISQHLVPAVDFEKAVMDMCSYHLACCGKYMRDVRSVSKNGHKPSGVLVFPYERDRLAVKSVQSHVCTLLDKNNFILHSDFVNLFSHLDDIRSRRSEACRMAKRLNMEAFNLSSGEKAWRMVG